MYLFSKTSRLALVPTQLPIQWVLGALSPGVNWLRYEIDHCPPSTAKVKNEWSCTSAPLVCPRDAYRDNFTFLSFTGDNSYLKLIRPRHAEWKMVGSFF
jgi:hypothetical protein